MAAKRPTWSGGPPRVLGWFRAGARMVRSDGAAAHARATRHRADHEDRDHGTDGRDDDRADVQRAVDGIGVEQDAGKESADERADDTEHDVSDDAETFVTLDEETGEVPGDGAEDDPRNDAHSLPPSPMRASHPLAGVRSPPSRGWASLSRSPPGARTTTEREHVTTA